MKKITTTTKKNKKTKKIEKPARNIIRVLAKELAWWGGKSVGP
jgi:hypothetical protein